jgi:hypothetical protein
MKTDHNGFPIDDVPSRLGDLPPVGVYRAQPVRITGLDPITGKHITVVANRIASGPDGKPFTFAEPPGSPRSTASRAAQPPPIPRAGTLEYSSAFDDDMDAVNADAILRYRK